MTHCAVSALSAEQLTVLSIIQQWQNTLQSSILNTAELALYMQMTKKKKEKLVRDIYFADKKSKEFYHCADGRVKSYKPQFICATEEKLIDKLFSYYFERKFEDIYRDWIKYRFKTKIVSGKTIEEDVGIWKRYIANTKLAEMNILDIKPKHIKEVFDTWTGNGLITRKAFNNRKSVLNGIFDYAVINELIERNPITSLSCSELKFKNSVPSQKAYTKDERQKLLDYLTTLEPDAYVLAITLAFYGIFRIGEIKGLVWDGKSNAITIQQQLVEERILQDDFSFSAPIRVLKDPKGNPHYSIRKEYLPDVAIEALNQMKALNPDGELLFMHRGRPLTTDTFNNRLKKYCGAVGIPYLSSHKIRFTNASILRDEGVDPIDIQPLLGHSNLAMAQHYIEQRVSNMDDTQMAKILA